MRHVLGLATVAVLIATPALAQKVAIDYAHDFEFSSVTSFQYVETPESDVRGNQLMANRIADLIRQELREGGLTETENNPDIYVTYHFTSEERSSYSTTGFGYGGYWGGWYRWRGSPVASTTTTEHSYTEGTLIIDAFDAAEKKMIWRGTGTVTVKATPEKQIRQVEKILDKLGKRWERILAGQGK